MLPTGCYFHTCKPAPHGGLVEGTCCQQGAISRPASLDHAIQWSYRQNAAKAILQSGCRAGGLTTCLQLSVVLWQSRRMAHGGLRDYMAQRWPHSQHGVALRQSCHNGLADDVPQCHKSVLTACPPLDGVLRRSCHTVVLQTTCHYSGLTVSLPRKWSDSMPATQSGLLAVMAQSGLTDDVPQRWSYRQHAAKAVLQHACRAERLRSYGGHVAK